MSNLIFGKNCSGGREGSAELHSAVSPIFNRQGVQRAGADGFSRAAEFNSAKRQIKNPRYGRVARKARRSKLMHRPIFSCAIFAFAGAIT